MIAYANNDINPYKTGKRWEQLRPFNITTISNLNVGNGIYYKIIYFKTTEGQFFLGINRIGCFLFEEDEIIHPDYVAQKLKLEIGCANNITDWLNIQLGLEVPEYGRYWDQFCISRKKEG